MANPDFEPGAFFKSNQVPAVIARQQRKKAKKDALDKAYAIVNTRDKNICQASGLKLYAQSADLKHLRTHHHLRGRNVAPELRDDPNNIILVSQCAHDLIHCGWLVVEGDDARKAIRFHWSEVAKPALRPFQLRSRHRSQQ